ncbi:hypothetical protein BKA63DRAFT_487088 [Paraphoma chrysanthemicola]|nr:hypothetical protein BKA63DRAFT_487088 [Paraphoma chrysanthemicola]
MVKRNDIRRASHRNITSGIKSVCDFLCYPFRRWYEEENEHKCRKFLNFRGGDSTPICVDPKCPHRRNRTQRPKEPEMRREEQRHLRPAQNGEIPNPFTRTQPTNYHGAVNQVPFSWSSSHGRSSRPYYQPPQAPVGNSSRSSSIQQDQAALAPFLKHDPRPARSRRGSDATIEIPRQGSRPSSRERYRPRSRRNSNEVGARSRRGRPPNAFDRHSSGLTRTSSAGSNRSNRSSYQYVEPVQQHPQPVYYQSGPVLNQFPGQGYNKPGPVFPQQPGRYPGAEPQPLNQMPVAQYQSAAELNQLRAQSFRSLQSKRQQGVRMAPDGSMMACQVTTVQQVEAVSLGPPATPQYGDPAHLRAGNFQSQT